MKIASSNRVFCGAARLSGFVHGLVFLTACQFVAGQSATITTAAGTGFPISNLANGISAASAQIPYPFDLDVDAQNNLYFIYGANEGTTGTTDIYRISTAGVLTRVFKLGTTFGLGYADGMAISPDGTAAYATDAYMIGSSVLKLTSAGQASIGSNHGFSFPITPTAGLRLRNGQLYVADWGNNQVVRIGTDNNATVIGGTGTGGYSGDGGLATAATFNHPQAITTDAAGNVFVVDSFNHCVRKIATNGIATTFAGVCTKLGFAGDGGLATAARLSQPSGIAVASDGTVYIADTNNNRIRRVNLDGTIETVAGGGPSCYSTDKCGDGGPATLASLNSPNGLALDSNGRLYIADTLNNRIRLLTFGPAPLPGTPQIQTTNGIVNGASFVAPVSTGSWATIYGQHFTTGAARLWNASDFVGNKLPTSLDGTSVTFNDLPAAMYYVSATQLNVQVPDGLPAGQVIVKVTNTVGTAVSGVQCAAVAPGLFASAQTTTADGLIYFYPAAVHLDGTLVGRSNVLPGSRPAVSGETVLVFGTGFGPSSPPQPSGFLITPMLLNSLPIVTFGGSRALIQASALISPGLYQFNVQLPLQLQISTDYEIQIGFLGGAQSQFGLFLPVN